MCRFQSSLVPQTPISEEKGLVTSCTASCARLRFVFKPYSRQDVYIEFTESLALRTRNDRLKNSFTPGGTLPTHPVGPKNWTCI